MFVYLKLKNSGHINTQKGQYTAPCFTDIWFKKTYQPAVVAERFRAYDGIHIDCHSRTQVQIPLEAYIYRVP